jgi:polyisoprenoid-binding protein YceI
MTDGFRSIMAQKSGACYLSSSRKKGFLQHGKHLLQQIYSSRRQNYIDLPARSSETLLDPCEILRLHLINHGPKAIDRKDFFIMKRLAIMSGILALATPLALAQTSTWISDKNHSEVDFNVLHLSISHVHGRLGNVAATIVLNQADVTKSTVTATIDVSTIDTGVGARDSDLKSANFFDVANFPTATFTSTGVVKNGANLTVTGNLTLHGVTKPVVLEVEGPTGPVQGMDHKPHSGFSATTTLSRNALGIGPKFAPAAIGDNIELTIELDVVKQ